MKNISQAIHSAVPDDEKIYATLHRHWFNVATQFVLIAIFALGVIIACAFIDALMINNTLENYRPINFFFTTLLLLFSWLVSFFIWVDYHLDVWVVTSGRVINIEQKGLFNREISELDYGHIQDATSEISGILQTALNYGDVSIQTAGAEGEFRFRRIAQPEKIKTLVMHLHRQALAKRMHPGNMSRTEAQSTQSPIHAAPPSPEKPVVT